MSEWFDKAMNKTDIDRSTGCWLYRGEIVHNGYGRVWREGKNVRVHRLSYEFFCEDIPKGLMVLHKCDIRNCWNPEHLFVGTARDNILDAQAKGRVHVATPKQKRGPSYVKLTAEQVADIKAHLSAGIKGPKLAAMYGVHKRSIYRIKNAQSWRNVPPASPAI